MGVGRVCSFTSLSLAERRLRLEYLRDNCSSLRTGRLWWSLGLLIGVSVLLSDTWRSCTYPLPYVLLYWQMEEKGNVRESYLLKVSVWKWLISLLVSFYQPMTTVVYLSGPQIVGYLLPKSSIQVLHSAPSKISEWWCRVSLPGLGMAAVSLKICECDRQITYLPHTHYKVVGEK